METDRTKSMRGASILVLCLLQIFAIGQHRSILIHDGNGVCEPSIAIDPSDTDRMVAGMVLDRVAHSKDGGENWSVERLTSPYGVWGDPVIDVDHEGRFYYFHLSNPPKGEWIDRIVCQWSEDGGENWTKGSFAGLNGSKDQDKHWSVIDPENGHIHITWTEFDAYGSKDTTCKSRIRYARSEDRGFTWTPAQTISTVSGNCLDDDETTEGAVPALGPSGELYVAWAGPEGLVFSSSSDGGESWTDEVSVDPMPGGWNMDIPGIYRANGLPITRCDRSDGPHRGRIYVNWADQRNGEDDTDIWLSYSDDRGKTWTHPARVDSDTGNAHQFFTWMDIDQTNGNLYFTFYDRRHFADSDSTSIYMAMSTDGGERIYDFPLESRELAFVPNSNIFFGDYTNVAAHDDVVRPIWTRLDDKNLSVWTSIVDIDRPRVGLYRWVIEAEVKPKKEYCLMLTGPSTEEVLRKGRSPKAQLELHHLLDLDAYPKGVYTLELKQGKKTLWKRTMEKHGETE